MGELTTLSSVSSRVVLLETVLANLDRSHEDQIIRRAIATGVRRRKRRAFHSLRKPQQACFDALEIDEDLSARRLASVEDQDVPNKPAPPLFLSTAGFSLGHW